MIQYPFTNVFALRCLNQLGIEELKQSLLYSTLELDAAVVSAHEELSRKDDEIAQLKALLAKIVEERDEFRAKCQELAMEKKLLFQQLQIQPHSSKQLSSECPISSNTTTTNVQDDNGDVSPSDSNDNNNVTATSPHYKDTLSQRSPTAPQRSSTPDAINQITVKKSLPEKGKFLQAVMEAGPLLQTLLLAGPLPQWQHPPPQLNSIDIPPVTINSPKMKVMQQESSCLLSPSGGFTNKRTMVSRDQTLDSAPKYQKVCSPIIIDSNI